MEIREKYSSPEQRQALFDSHKNKRLLYDHTNLDGSTELVFTDQPEPLTIESLQAEIKSLEARLEALEART